MSRFRAQSNAQRFGFHRIDRNVRNLSSHTVCQMPVVRGYQSSACSLPSCFPRGCERSPASSSARADDHPAALTDVLSDVKGCTRFGVPPRVFTHTVVGNRRTERRSSLSRGLPRLNHAGYHRPVETYYRFAASVGENGTRMAPLQSLLTEGSMPVGIRAKNHAPLRETQSFVYLRRGSRVSSSPSARTTSTSDPSTHKVPGTYLLRTTSSVSTGENIV